MSETVCRWDGRGKPRLLRTHLNDDCNSACEGCQPCAENHCGICGREHVGTNLTCPSCIGTVRDDIETIVAMSARMLAEAVHRGVNSEAANLAGPVADPEAWTWRKAAARAGKADHITLTEDDESTHPAWVLGTWEMLVREHLEQPSGDLLTIAAAAFYLDLHLTRLAQDGDFAFEELARDVRDCRGRLEDVLRDGDREERGEKCYMCDKKHLVKDYGKTPTSKVMWRCPNTECRQSYTEQEYADKVKTRYIGAATELTMTDLAVRLWHIPAGTMRRWANKQATGAIVDGEKVYTPARLKSCGKDDSGRRLFRVADVEALSVASGKMSA